MAEIPPELLCFTVIRHVSREHAYSHELLLTPWASSSTLLFFFKGIYTFVTSQCMYMYTSMYKSKVKIILLECVGKQTNTFDN